METNKIYKLIEEYVKYVYRCDGQALSEEDEFFDDLLEKHNCGSEDARLVNRRIEELGIGSTTDNRLSLFHPGVMMVEKYGGSMERFLREYQEKTSAEVKLPAEQLKEIQRNKIRSTISIIISIISLAATVFSVVREILNM